MITAIFIVYAYSATAPYPRSTHITGINFRMGTAKTQAPGSDNWVITWADDDRQYTSWGDGGGFGGTNSDGRVSFGVGSVSGSKSSYTTKNIWGGKNAVTSAKFGGKSYGILSLDGDIYMWRCGTASDNSAFNIQDLYKSTDKCVNFSNTGVKFEQSDFSVTRGFFAVTFLQFGKDYAGARDNYIYMYGNEVQNTTWDVQKPGKISLIRCLKGDIANRSRYEYFTGMSGGNPTWTSNRDQRKPVFQDIANGIMRTSVSYNAPLGRYLLTTQQVDRHRSDNGHIGIYDAPEPWGPWTTVLFDNAWDVGIAESGASKTVYWNFSNKWLSSDGKSFVMVGTLPGQDEWGTVEGTFTAGSVKLREVEQNRSGDLGLKLYPNPFKSTLRVLLPMQNANCKLQNAKLTIYDMTGKQIRATCDVRRATYVWDGAEHTNGTYVVKATVNGRHLSETVTMIK
jgi:hypothetical protein